MKTITINKGDLTSLLYEGGVFAGKNRAIPILSCVRLTTKGEKIRCESADAESHICAYAECECSENVSFCVNHKELSNYVGCITGEKVVLEYDESNNNLTVSHTNGTLNMVALKSIDFPQMRKVDEGSVELNGEILSHWLNTATQFCFSTDLTTAIAGVNIYANEETIGVIGANHNCVFMATTANKNNTPDFNVVLKKDTASVLAKVIRPYNTVKLSFDQNSILVTSDDLKLLINIMEVKYPDVKVALNKIGTTTAKFSVSGSELKAAVKRIVTQIPEAKLNAVHLQHSKGCLSLRYDACLSTHKKVCNETLVASGSEFLECMVNIHNLTNVLNNYPSEDMQVVKDSHERAPFMFTYEGEDVAEKYMLGVMI